MDLFRTGAFTNKQTEEVNYYIDIFNGETWLRLSGHQSKEQWNQVLNDISKLGGIIVQHTDHVKMEEENKKKYNNG